jgi:hypothetical protein
MEPDPHASGPSLVASLWLAAFVLGVIVVLTTLAAS